MNSIPTDALQTAVEAVLRDDGFSVPTFQAVETVVTARKVLKADPRQLSEFGRELIGLLEPCFGQTQSMHTRDIREKMWSQYHKVRATKSFRAKWEQFLTQVVASSSCPTFYQYVTDQLFQMICHHFPIHEDRSQEEIDHSTIVGYEESNVLRYVSGYLCRSLRKFIHSDRFRHPSKQDLLLCLDDLTTEEQDEQVEDWTNLIDRGGLVH